MWYSLKDGNWKLKTAERRKQAKKLERATASLIADEILTKEVFMCPIYNCEFEDTNKKEVVVHIGQTHDAQTIFKRLTD